MKKNYLKALLCLLTTVCTISCTNEIEVETPKMTNGVSTKSYILAKEKLKNSITQIKESAWDGNAIDVSSFESIIQKETGWSKERIYNLENVGLKYTRSDNEDSCELSERQKVFLEEIKVYFSDKGYISDDDFSLVENKIQKFPLKEKDEIMQGLLIAKLTQDAIQESFLMTRGLSLKSFACNLATGGIATVWGEMAAGVAIFCGASAVVTGGASVVVSLVGGSLLSSVAC